MKTAIGINILINIFFQNYENLWVSYYGKFIYRFSGRDRTKMKKIINLLGSKETNTRLKNFYLDKNNWVVDRTHALSIFCACIDQYKKRKRVTSYAKSKIEQHKEFNIEEEIKKTTS